MRSVQWLQIVVRVFFTDLVNGGRLVLKNTFVMTGLIVAAIAYIIHSQPDLRYMARNLLIDLIQQTSDIPADATAMERATVFDPASLNPQERQVAQWMSSRYSVGLEPAAALVRVAFSEAKREQLDPALILAVLCIESSVHPYAQSPVGAVGLMQVMTKIHRSKYERYGGEEAAFDPVTNLRVGIQVLKEYIRLRGSVEEGLKFYVGAGLSGEDGGYASKVMQETVRIQAIMAGGRSQD